MYLALFLVTFIQKITFRMMFSIQISTEKYKTWNTKICFYPNHPLLVLQVEMDGLTGRIKFDQRGQRTDFELDIIELKRDGLTKVFPLQELPEHSWTFVLRLAPGLKNVVWIWVETLAKLTPRLWKVCRTKLWLSPQ